MSDYAFVNLKSFYFNKLYKGFRILKLCEGVFHIRIKTYRYSTFYLGVIKCVKMYIAIFIIRFDKP